MDSELVETLNLVGYTGNLLNLDDLQFALKDGIKSKDYRQLVVWLASEIKPLGELEELVQEEDDVNTFMVELSGLLKELRCPHNDLITGHVSDRLQTVESRTLLLDFLLTELMGLKMYNVNKPKDTSNVITIHETPIAAALKDLTIALSMGKPPENISPKILFDRMAGRLDEVIRKAGAKRLGKPLFNPNKNLTMDQWKLLEAIQKDLDEEYDIRRKMMLTRLDVTIQSFQWSDRLKGKEDLVAKEFTPRRKKLDDYQFGGEDTNISALLAARDSLAIIEKTSNSSVRKLTKSKIQRLIIGQVPDRGGRAHEHIPPPPEMPSWSQRGGGGGGRGGGGRGGGRGGSGDRGGRGGGRGGGHGGATPWIQPPQNFQQNQSTGYQQNYNQQSQLNQNYNYQQQQQQQQQQQSQSGYNQYDNRGGAGGGRVQGGWSQKGTNQDYNQSRGGYDSNSQDRSRGGGGGGRDYNQGYSSYNRGGGSGGGGGGGGERGGRGGGRSNYNRGGGAGNRY